MFYQGGPIDNFTHVMGQIAQNGAESEYNVSYTTFMVLAHFRVLNN